MKGVRCVFVLLALGACDSSSEGFPPSQFGAVWAPDAAIAGKVRRDREWVEGALVRLEAPNLGPTVMTTNGYGWYRFETNPSRYDLSVLDGHEVTVFRDLKSRYGEPLLAGSALPRAFTAQIDVIPDDPLPANTKLVFAVSGTDVVGLTGDGPADLTLAFRPFELLAKPGDTTCLSGAIVHAIQIAEGGTLAAPLAYGSTCVPRVVANERRIVGIKMTPVEQKLVDFTVKAAVPPNMVAEPVEMAVDFGDYKATLPVARFANGATTSFVRIPQARYSVRMRARNGLAMSDSGVTFVELEDKVEVLELATPSEVSAPARTSTGELVFEVKGGIGVRELALVPAQAGATSVRIVTTNAQVVVPDVRKLGVPALAGRTSVHVRTWPKLANTDALTGLYARDTFAFADAAGYDFTP